MPPTLETTESTASLRTGEARLRDQSAADRPGAREARHLLSLADDIMSAVPGTAAPFVRWRERAQALLDDPDLETVRGEAALNRLSLDLRTIWMRIAHGYSDRHLKSPLRGTDIRFPTGESTPNRYERLMYPTNLEVRCRAYRPRPGGWRARHMLFRSGMAAITAVLQNARPFLFADQHEPVTVDFFGGYFETTRLLKLFSSPLFSYRRHDSPDSLFRTIETGGGQILFLEPVSYDWEMAVLNVDRLCAALAGQARVPTLIVLDTTIVGHTFPLDDFLARLPGRPPPIVMQLSSCLKLDQEGLELANAGIASVFWPKTDAAQGEVALTFARKMRRNRKITGTGLSADEMAILDVPWFLDAHRFEAHCERVFENNRRLAAALAPVVASSDGLFSHVSHPGLSASAAVPWAVAPFVVLHLRQELDAKDTHDRLTALLRGEAQGRGLDFGEGMSFGFRSHRFEIIKPNSILHPNGREKGVLKIAMGCREGPSMEAIIDVLSALARCRDVPDAIDGSAGEGGGS